jgi:two-component system, response regulator, stage 0 sporulation protein F
MSTSEPTIRWVQKVPSVWTGSAKLDTSNQPPANVLPRRARGSSWLASNSNMTTNDPAINAFQNCGGLCGQDIAESTNQTPRHEPRSGDSSSVERAGRPALSSIAILGGTVRARAAPMKRSGVVGERDPSTCLLSTEPLPLSVLLAEDDAALRAILSQVLRRDGHEVTELCDGAQLATALAIPLESQICSCRNVLVLADVRLPVFDSLTVIRTVRARGHRPRVALMSAFADQDLEESARDLEALALFGKPFDLEALRSFVRYVGRWQ